MLFYLEEGKLDQEAVLLTSGLDSNNPSEIWYSDEIMDISYGPGLYNIYPSESRKNRFMGYPVQTAPIEDNESLLEAAAEKLRTNDRRGMTFSLEAILRCRHRVTNDVFYAIKLKNIFKGAEDVTLIAYRNIFSLHPDKIRLDVIEGEIYGTLSGMIRDGENIKSKEDEDIVTTWIASSQTSYPDTAALAGHLPGNPKIYQMFSGYLVYDADKECNGGRLIMRRMKTNHIITHPIPKTAVKKLIEETATPEVTDVVLSRLKDLYYSMLDIPELDNLMMSSAPRIAGLINLSKSEVIETANSFRVYIVNRKIVSINFLNQRGEVRSFAFGMSDGMLKSVPRVYALDNPKKDITRQVLNWMENNHMYIRRFMEGRFMCGEYIVSVREPLLKTEAMEVPFVKRSWPMKRCVNNGEIVILPVNIAHHTKPQYIPFWNMRVADQIWLLSDTTREECNAVMEEFNECPVVKGIFMTLSLLVTEDLHIDSNGFDEFVNGILSRKE